MRTLFRLIRLEAVLAITALSTPVLAQNTAPSAAPPAAGAPAPSATPEPTAAPENDHDINDWYQRRSTDPRAPKRPPLPGTWLEPVSILLDGGFFFGSEPVSGSVGSIRADVAALSSWFGLYGGVAFNSGLGLAGLDFFRFVSGLRIFATGTYELRVVPPHLEIGGFFGSTTGIEAGVSPVGLRATDCATHTFADLRPLFELWVDPETNGHSAASASVQLTVGYVFDLTPKPKPYAKKKKQSDDEEDDSGGDDAPKKKKDDSGDDQEEGRLERCPVRL